MSDSVANSVTGEYDLVVGTPDMGVPDSPVGSSGSDPVAIALNIIEGFEGFSAKAYNDPPGSNKWSIGYGHQIKTGESYNSSSVIGQSEAHDLLRVDVGAAWTCVYRTCGDAGLNANQYAALISLCYNIGCTAFTSSSVVKAIQSGNLDTAAENFRLWNKSGSPLAVNDGLVARRDDEAALFQQA